MPISDQLLKITPTSDDPQEHFKSGLAGNLPGGVGVREMQGKRKGANEDAFTAERFDASKLTLEQFETLVQKTVNVLQERLTGEKEINSNKQGTTYVNAVIDTSKTQSDGEIRILTAMLGDSETFLVRIDREGKATGEELYEHLHNPDVDSETTRIKGLGYEVIPFFNAYRLPSGLAVSRAIGDNDSVWCGLSRKIDTLEKKFTLDTNETAFVLVMCDGIREGFKDSADITAFVAEKFKESPTITAAAMAEALCSQALIHSGDNLAAMVRRITQDNPGESCMATLCDGHGGPDVSHYVIENHHPILMSQFTPEK